MNPDSPLVLACHPRTPSRDACRLSTRVRRDAGVLRLSFTIEADLARLRIAGRAPGRAAARRSDGLWEHTCFEAFVARAEACAYHEFNFAPSGSWAAYAFEDYRAGFRRADEVTAPRLGVRRDAGSLRLFAAVRLDLLSPAHVVEPLRLALSAVVEDDAGGLSYWALAHPPGKPDFHHPAGFVLRLGENGAVSAAGCEEVPRW